MARFKNRNTGTIVSVEDGRELPAVWEEIVETPADETPADETPADEKPAPKSRAKKTASSDEDE
jgi:hypothetical protein